MLERQLLLAKKLHVLLKKYIQNGKRKLMLVLK